MLQKMFESLLLIAIKKEIDSKLDKSNIIYTYGKSYLELPSYHIS